MGDFDVVGVIGELNQTGQPEVQNSVCVRMYLHTHKRKSTRGNNTRSVLAIFKNALC